MQSHPSDGGSAVGAPRIAAALPSPMLIPLPCCHPTCPTPRPQPPQVTQGRDAKVLKDALANEGIMVRHYAKKELSGFVRVSVGKPEHTDALMAVLRRL